MASIGTTRAPATRVPAKSRTSTSARQVDLATVLGVAGAFALIFTAMMLGGSFGAFIDVPALLIVFGGTFMVTSVSFTLREVIAAQSVMLRAVIYHQRQPSATANQVLDLADRARRGGGPLVLQKALADLRGDPFLHKAVAMVVDGLGGDEIQRVLDREVEATMDRHRRSAGVLRRAGEVAPAMGLIGTLVGLVQMLGNLEDPTTIGPAMAVALLTTFYGAVLANMVFLPLANKLERNADVEARVKQIIALGAASIGRQENPRRLEMLVNTILAPPERVRHFD